MESPAESVALTPGEHWYHGIKRGERFLPIVGPFQTREEADALHFQAAVAAAQMDGRTCFMAWGTANYTSGAARGSFNAWLGVLPFISQRQTWALARQSYQREL